MGDKENFYKLVLRDPQDLAGAVFTNEGKQQQSQIALTNSFVESDSVDLRDSASATFSLKYTKGVGTGLEFYIEDSHDGSDWVRRQVEEASSGSGTITLRDELFSRTTSGTLPIPAVRFLRFTRIVFRSTGTPDATDKIAITVNEQIVGE